MQKKFSDESKLIELIEKSSDELCEEIEQKHKKLDQRQQREKPWWEKINAEETFCTEATKHETVLQLAACGKCGWTIATTFDKYLIQKKSGGPVVAKSRPWFYKGKLPRSYSRAPESTCSCCLDNGGGLWSTWNRYTVNLNHDDWEVYNCNWADDYKELRVRARENYEENKLETERILKEDVLREESFHS